MTMKITALLFLFITITNCRSFGNSDDYYFKNNYENNNINVKDGIVRIKNCCNVCEIRNGKVYHNRKFLRNETEEDRQKLAKYQAQVQEWSKNLSKYMQQNFLWYPRNPYYNFIRNSRNPYYINVPWNQNNPGTPLQYFPWSKSSSRYVRSVERVRRSLIPFPKPPNICG